MEHTWPFDELLGVEVVRAQEALPWTHNRTQQSWVALLLKTLALTFNRVWKAPFSAPPLPLFEHSRTTKEKEAIFPGGDEWGERDTSHESFSEAADSHRCRNCCSISA